MIVDKAKMLDTSNRPITQGLFLEMGYSEFALYTMKDNDHEYKGVVYPSIKKIYLEMEDTTEYEFANMYFLGWKHWTRICENKMIRVHIDEWREELELKLRSRAIKQMMDLAEQGSYQASKWLSDRGWDIKVAGRPSKAEKQRQAAINERIGNEYGADIHRLFTKTG